MKKLTFTITLCTFILTSFAQSMDEKIKLLANDIANQIVANGGTKVAVTTIGFKSCEVTEFGKYLAQEITGYLSTSGRKMSVVNQELLEKLLEQNKLTAKGLLEAQNEAAKLGKASGINALVYGTITILGEELKLSLTIVRLPTLEVYGFTKGSVPLTSSIKNMLDCQTNNQTSQTDPTIPENNSNTNQANCKANNICTVCVTNQSNQDITTTLHNYKNSNKPILINPNKTECWKEVLIKSGLDFESMRWIVRADGRIVVNERVQVEACKTYNKIFKN